LGVWPGWATVENSKDLNTGAVTTVLSPGSQRGYRERQGTRRLTVLQQLLKLSHRGDRLVTGRLPVSDAAGDPQVLFMREWVTTTRLQPLAYCRFDGTCELTGLVLNGI
jgi:hypothetical protein